MAAPAEQRESTQRKAERNQPRGKDTRHSRTWNARLSARTTGELMRYRRRASAPYLSITRVGSCTRGQHGMRVSMECG